MPVETFHPTSLLRYAAALAGSVVATVSVSVNADYDYGVHLQQAARRRRAQVKKTDRT
jgi:hypothetical protein